MKLLKVNRKNFVDVNNIEKIVIKNTCIWVYQKIGYPKVYKCRESWTILKNRLINLGIQPLNLVIEYETF